MTQLPTYAGEDWASAILRMLAVTGKAMIALASVGTACTYLPDGPWYLQGAAYWVSAYLALGIAGTLACLFVRARRWSCLGLACVLAVAGLIIPCYAKGPNSAPPGAKPNLRILQANVYEHRGNAAALMDLIGETRPDVVLLQEADEEWESRLQPLEADYPHKAFLPRFVRSGPDLALYWRADSNEPKALAAHGIPGVLLALDINGQRIPLLNVHLSAPFLPGRAMHHREQMLALADFVKSAGEPLIVAGDMNSGPWSQQCRALLRDTGLVSVRQGRGILGTWPSFFGPLRVGIDQMLVSPGIQVVRCRVGPGVWSDHRPLITDLFIAPPGAAG
jgi:endonuclease/exonuclease/phosphatase (EEP) superfamily protein YafD